MSKSLLVRSALLLTIVSVTGCASWRHKEAQDTAEQVEAEKAPLSPTDQKIETLTAALSKAQTRIEELEAKISSLNDSVESTKIAVENVAGASEVRTVAVGRNNDGVPTPPAPKRETKNVYHRPAKRVANDDQATGAFLDGMNLFRKGSYAEAARSFTQFVENYPDHALAGSAQFYSGESYLMMSEFKRALPEYQKVVSSFGSSPRVPSAIVRLAHVNNALGNNQEAARLMALATDNFPGNPSLDWPAPRVAHTAKPEAAASDETATIAVPDRQPQSVSKPATQEQHAHARPAAHPGDHELDAAPMDPPPVKTSDVH